MLAYRHIPRVTEQSYAAVALKASNGFETITIDTTKRNTDAKAVMTPSLGGSDPSVCNIQMGVMSIATPMTTMTADANLSIRWSEKYATFPAS